MKHLLVPLLLIATPSQAVVSLKRHSAIGVEQTSWNVITPKKSELPTIRYTTNSNWAKPAKLGQKAILGYLDFIADDAQFTAESDTKSVAKTKLAIKLILGVEKQTKKDSARTLTPTEVSLQKFSKEKPVSPHTSYWMVDTHRLPADSMTSENLDLLVDQVTPSMLPFQAQDVVWVTYDSKTKTCTAQHKTLSSAEPTQITGVSVLPSAHLAGPASQIICVVPGFGHAYFEISERTTTPP